MRIEFYGSRVAILDLRLPEYRALATEAQERIIADFNKKCEVLIILRED